MNRFGRLFSLLLLGVCGCGSVEQASIVPVSSVVSTQQGSIEGRTKEGVTLFAGVPFAAPPVAGRRFRPPAPYPSWEGVRKTQTFGSSCRRSEDCLTLNVYTPTRALNASDKLPVMLFLHGGGFVVGSGADHDGTQFARQGVVLVTSNYRLGRAGWFAHPALTQENPEGELANYGLMDQIAALKWIRENIANFGGDADNVTLFGSSAGGISVNFLMLAQQAQGYFHRAVSQSGFGRMAHLPLRSDDGALSAERFGRQFAESLGINGADANAAAALRALPFETLMAPSKTLTNPAARPLPIIDGRLIVSNVMDGFAAGRQAKVPYVAGGNSDEASRLRRDLPPTAVVASMGKRKADFLALYDPTSSGDIERVASKFMGDQWIEEPNRALARLHAKNGLPTYLYHFSYVPLAQRGSVYGLRHGGEKPFVFNIPPEGGFDELGANLATAANNYWVAFARNGEPGSVDGTLWPVFEPENEARLEFPHDGIPLARKNFNKDRLDWVESLTSSP